MVLSFRTWIVLTILLLLIRAFALKWTFPWGVPKFCFPRFSCRIPTSFSFPLSFLDRAQVSTRADWWSGRSAIWVKDPGDFSCSLEQGGEAETPLHHRDQDMMLSNCQDFHPVEIEDGLNGCSLPSFPSDLVRGPQGGQGDHESGCALLVCAWLWGCEFRVGREEKGMSLPSTPGNQWLEEALKTTRRDALTRQMERAGQEELSGMQRCARAANHTLTGGRAWAKPFPHSCD